MWRVTWMMLFGAACAGCANKEAPDAPNVAIRPDEPGGDGSRATFPPPNPQPKTFGLAYSKLWNPRAAKFDPEAAMKTVVAERYFAAHQTEYLTAATVGTAVALGQGSAHGVFAPAALAVVYPDVAKKLESEWTDRIGAPLLSDTPMLDATTEATGAPATRVRVFRVKGGTDDELRILFGEYLTRVEEAVKGTGATITAHRRGGVRATGALSDISYEEEGRAGYVRSVVVRGYDEKDAEFVGTMFGDGAKGRNATLFKSVMSAETGPYLVVAQKDGPR